MTQKIVVKDRQDTIEIGFDDVEKYHGWGSIAGAAVAFKALQAAFTELFPDQPAPREEIAITSGHPGPGVRDAIEMVTRAVTRGAYTVDTTRPQARWNPYRALSFSFIVAAADGRRAEVVLREGVLPARFFDLLEAVLLPDSGKERQELDQLKRALADEIMGPPASEIFTVDASHTTAGP